MTVTGTTRLSASQTWVMPSFLPRIPLLAIAVSQGVSTPAVWTRLPVASDRPGGPVRMPGTVVRGRARSQVSVVTTGDPEGPGVGVRLPHAGAPSKPREHTWSTPATWHRGVGSRSGAG